MNRKTLENQIHQLKNILIYAHQKGESSPNVTTKDFVKDLANQLEHIVYPKER